MKQSIVGIVYSSDRKMILAIKRCDVPIWVFAGGGIDPGESPEQATLREIHEESGVQAEIIRLVGEYSKTTWLTSPMLVYECIATGGSPTRGKETREVGFFPIEKLPVPFFPIHEAFLKDSLNHSECVKKPIPLSSWNYTLTYAAQHPIFTLRYLLAKLGLSLNTR